MYYGDTALGAETVIVGAQEVEIAMEEAVVEEEEMQEQVFANLAGT